MLHFPKMQIHSVLATDNAVLAANGFNLTVQNYTLTRYLTGEALSTSEAQLQTPGYAKEIMIAELSAYRDRC